MTLKENNTETTGKEVRLLGELGLGKRQGCLERTGKEARMLGENWEGGKALFSVGQRNF